MSHQPLRTETNCLNCGTDVAGRYCQNCGQENIVNKQSAWALITHFVYDIFHFDGKFFETLKYLFFRPGRVPLAYVSGKRQSYLDPIRMYLFTSAVFFLIFFGIKKIEFRDDSLTAGPLSPANRFALAASVKSGADSFSRYVLRESLDTTRLVYFRPLKRSSPDSLVTFRGERYGFLSRPDSFEFGHSDWLKGKGWLQRYTRSRVEAIQERVKRGDETLQSLIFNDVLHRLPYLLFVSLPFFALLLKMLYFRRRKNYFYSDHLIFTLYHYIFSFILLLLVMLSAEAGDYTGWGLFGWINFALMLYAMYYLYKGMRVFYEQSRGKTILKFVLLNLMAFFMVVVLFLVFIMISASQIH
ncbi:DUF3667 domain-containing protein [Flaviaesturariibacter flavus]|uniref:DUF3667 domain-containing protein n=1 Tax=Flaviaesturariibacter flavus TaxID=2502780 RepID=UPI001404BBE0|nr:DUF3667 domain-containing protein [Flaviaesturariibacter flavus]